MADDQKHINSKQKMKPKDLWKTYEVSKNNKRYRDKKIDFEFWSTWNSEKFDDK